MAGDGEVPTSPSNLDGGSEGRAFRISVAYVQTEPSFPSAFTVPWSSVM